jgi:hypothetical protein
MGDIPNDIIIKALWGFIKLIQTQLFKIIMKDFSIVKLNSQLGFHK